MTEEELKKFCDEHGIEDGELEESLEEFAKRNKMELWEFDIDEEELDRLIEAQYEDK